MPYPYSPLLQKLPIPAFFIDLEGVATIVSEPAAEMGYCSGEKVSQAWLLDFISSDVVEEERLIECKEAWWQVQLKKVEDGVVVVATNVSSQVALQQEMIESNERRSAISRAVLGHDAKTILTGLNHYLAIALEDSPDNKFIASAQVSADRLAALLASFSQFYGAGQSKQRLFTFRELVEDCLHTLQPKVTERETEISLDGNGTTVWGDVVRLGQVVTNLIFNALHYQPRNINHIRKVAIEISPDPKDSSFVILKVSDNGLGISEEHHSNIFQARIRLHPPHEYSGSGWGLAIAKQVVLEHQGSIGVTSEEGNGAQFWIRLPRTQKHTPGRR